MAIRDTTQLEQPVPSSSALPTRIPLLPDEMLSRFKSARDFNDNLDKFWRDTRKLILSDHDNVVYPLNQVLGDQDLLFAQQGNLLAEIQRVDRAWVDGDEAVVTTLTALIASSTGVRTYVQTTAPAGAAPGDLWFDSDDGFKMYRWDGAAWVAIDDVRIGGNVAAISTEQTARITADSAMASQITALIARLDTGDIATAISTLNVAVGPGGALATSITALTARLNTGDIATAISSLQTFAGPGGTTATSLTALTASFGTLSSAFTSEVTTRADADSALSDRIDTLTATAGIHTFLQSTTPTAGGVGDLWFDTSDNFKLKRWSGSAWVAADDSRIASNIAAITDEQTARIDADTAFADDMTALVARLDTGDIATAISDLQTYAGPGGTLASSLTTLTTTVGGHTTSISNEITARADADGFLSGKYTLRINVDGNVSGMNISSSTSAGTNTSEVSFLANVFKVYTTAGNVAPFVISGTTVTVDGSVLVKSSVAPVTNASPGSAGLYLGADKLGYWNGSAWKSYLTNSGTFFLSGTGTNQLSWDGTALAITGSLTLDSASSIKGGQTAYDTGTGFFLGYSSGYKLSIGNASGNKLTWDGSTLALAGNVTCGDNQLTAANSVFKYDINSSGGTAVALGYNATAATMNNIISAWANSHTELMGSLGWSIAGGVASAGLTALGSNPAYLMLNDDGFTLNPAGGPACLKATDIYFRATTTHVKGDLSVDGVIDAPNTGSHILATNVITGGGIELGATAFGDRYAIIDFHSDDTNTDYSARIARQPGVGAVFEINNAGNAGTRGHIVFTGAQAIFDLTDGLTVDDLRAPAGTDPTLGFSFPASTKIRLNDSSGNPSTFIRFHYDSSTHHLYISVNDSAGLFLLN